jgi:hypothetical protein
VQKPLREVREDATRPRVDQRRQIGLAIYGPDAYLEADTELAQFGLATPEEQTRLLGEYSEPDLLVLDDLFLARKISDAGAELDRHGHDRVRVLHGVALEVLQVHLRKQRCRDLNKSQPKQ